MAGEGDKLKGKIKEVAGAVTGDEKTESEGKLDQAKGHLKGAGENLKDHAKDAMNKAAEKVRRTSEDAEDKTRSDPED
jgi:uncharacterized protein YjbJ (UPF0337 family)